MSVRAEYKNPSRVVPSDQEGRIFLSYHYTNNGFFFLHNSKYLILYLKRENGFLEILNTL